MANFGPLAVEIGSGVWGTPANFNGFRVLASLLQRRRSTEVNQTLRDAWPSPGLVRYVRFRGCCRLVEFCKVQNSLCVQVLRSPILASLLHGTPAAGVSQTLRHGTRNRITEICRRRHLYSAGRPSHSSNYLLLLFSKVKASLAFSVPCIKRFMAISKQ